VARDGIERPKGTETDKLLIFERPKHCKQKPVGGTCEVHEKSRHLGFSTHQRWAKKNIREKIEIECFWKTFRTVLGCRFAQESFDLVVQIFRNPERITVSVRS